MSLKPGEEQSVMLRLTVPFLGCAYDRSDCNQLIFNIEMPNNRKPMCDNTPIAGQKGQVESTGGYSSGNCWSTVNITDWSEEQFTNFTIQAQILLLLQAEVIWCLLNLKQPPGVIMQSGITMLPCHIR